MLNNQDADEEDFSEAMELSSRHVSLEQFKKFEGYMAEIFTAFGMDTNTPSTLETPKRFVRAMFDITSGYEGDEKLLKVFEAEYRGDSSRRLSQVIEGPIRFFALCEHHALPFYGDAYVGYIPDEKIIGLSKLIRLVRLFAKRFTVQERMEEQIADTLQSVLQPHGVAVYLQAHHLCTEMRGVREHGAITRTTTWRGEYITNATLRAEFYAAAGLQR